MAPAHVHVADQIRSKMSARQPLVHNEGRRPDLGLLAGGLFRDSLDAKDDVGINAERMQKREDPRECDEHR